MGLTAERGRGRLAGKGKEEKGTERKGKGGEGESDEGPAVCFQSPITLKSMKTKEGGA